MTLTELKRTASNYVWTITAHPYGHKLFGVPREVKHVQSNGIQFIDGFWLYWPKASEASFFMSSGDLCFSIDLEGKAMTYKLETKGA